MPLNLKVGTGLPPKVKFLGEPVVLGKVLNGVGRLPIYVNGKRAADPPTWLWCLQLEFRYPKIGLRQTISRNRG